jgi:hypothetical protein
MRSLRLACAVALSLLPTAMPAQTCVPTLLGADRRGPAESISRTGSTLYVGTGAALLVVDVTVRSEPVERGFVNLDGIVRDVAAAGSIAVVLADTGLVFVEASDPDQPAIAGTWPIPAEWDVQNVSVRATLAFVPAADGLHIVDFANPASADEIGFLAAAGTRDFVPRGTSLGYLVAAGSLVVVDFSDPTSPDALSSQTLPSGAVDALAIGPNGGQLAVWGNSSLAHRYWWDLAFFTLADPDSPALRSIMTGDDDVLAAVTLAGGRAYLDDRIVDISTLNDPVVLGTFDHLVREHSTTGDPSLIYVADAHLGVAAVDVSDPTSTSDVHTIPLPVNSLGGYVAGSTAVVFDLQGLRVYDLSDPGAPALLADLRSPQFWFDSVARISTHALVGGIFDGANRTSRLVDLSDPQSPMIGEDLPWTTDRAVIVGRRLYARISCAEAVTIFDVEDPANPTQVGEVELSNDCWEMDFAVAGRRLHVWDYVGGYPDYPQALFTFDVSDPAAPVELGSPIRPLHRGSSATSGAAGVLAEPDHLEVLDLREPTAPELIGSTPLPLSHSGIPRALEIYGGRAGVSTVADPFLGYEDIRARIVDFTDPAAPHVWATLETPGYAHRIFFGPGVVAVADGPAGISVFDSCAPFADGFESGDASEWSLIAP